MKSGRCAVTCYRSFLNRGSRLCHVRKSQCVAFPLMLECRHRDSHELSCARQQLDWTTAFIWRPKDWDVSVQCTLCLLPVQIRHFSFLIV